MARGVFIAGTDTGVGKTAVGSGLLAALAAAGFSTLAIKPVAAGCQATADGLRNDDALALAEAMTAQLPYDQVNPVALPEPIAPHIAAARAGRRLDVARLAGFCRGVLLRREDWCVVEGAGGWRVPLNERETLADLARELQLPVVLVVGLRLGCLNHALLTAEAIARDGLRLAGWVANQVDADMAEAEANLEYLRRHLGAPCLGRVPRLALPSPSQVAKYIDVSPLTGVT